jgi:hypothetical protein
MGGGWTVGVLLAPLFTVGVAGVITREAARGLAGGQDARATRPCEGGQGPEEAFAEQRDSRQPECDEERDEEASEDG